MDETHEAEPESGMVVSVDDAGSQFAELIALVERGRHVVISREGEPIARLVPFAAARRSPRSV